MSIDFTEIEGLEAELAEKLNSNEGLQNAITTQLDTSVANRVDVAKSEFKKKMDALDAKLRAAEEKAANAPDIDPDELKALREARDKNPELQATLKEIQKGREQAEAQREAAMSELSELRMQTAVSRAIDDYNTKHPTVTVPDDMRDVVSMLASQSLKYDDETKAYKAYDSKGDIIVTDKGAATPVDWLAWLRNERPSLFNRPNGSGASGSTHNGSAKKFTDMSEAERVALYREDPSRYRELKGH